MPKAPLRIGVLASGAGTTLQAVIDASVAGPLNADVVVVVSNNSGSGALARARRHHIPAVHLSDLTHPGGGLDVAMLETLEAYDVDVVLLAGYMKKIGAKTLAAFSGRMVNTHPALLPRHGGKGMYGSLVHEAVLASGDRVTGVTVHLVEDGEYDSGRVLAQCQVPVEADDDRETLTARVQGVEREFLIDVLQRIATGKISLES